jgi:hypothetical protein
MRKNLPYKVTLFFRVTALEVDMGAYAVQVPSQLGRFLAFTLHHSGVFRDSIYSFVLWPFGAKSC